jgi:hypothetical protein
MTIGPFVTYMYEQTQIVVSFIPEYQVKGKKPKERVCNKMRQDE